MKLSSFCNLLFLGACLATLSACDNVETQALGTLERDRIVLKANASEFIVNEPVEEGSKVSVGMLLVQLDDRRQKSKVAQAQAELTKAESFWEQLRNGARAEDVKAARAKVDGAKANVVIAEKNYLRAKQLLEQKTIAQITFDRAVADRDSAEADLNAAIEALALLTNGTRQEELDQAEAAFHAASAQLELEAQALEELSIRATRDGYLDSLPWNVGERVNQGTTVAVVLADKSPFARVYVPEPWRSRVNVGDAFAVRVDGIENPLQSRLRWISNDPAFTPYYALNAEDRSRLVFLAEFDLENGDDLPSGVPVQVILKEASVGDN